MGIRTDGSEVPIRVQIGTPYELEEHLWACPVALPDLFRELADQRGGDSLQALCLAVGLVRNLLLGFVEDGGRIVFPHAPSQEVPLDAYFTLALRDRPGV